MSVQTPVIVKLIFRIHIRKKPPQGGFLALFLLHAQALSSGAKVKEAENSSIHACITLSGKKRQSCIEKPAPIKVNVLMVLKRKEGDKLSFNWLMPELLSLFDQSGERYFVEYSDVSQDLTVDFNRGFFRPLMNLL